MERGSPRFRAASHAKNASPIGPNPNAMSQGQSLPALLGYRLERQLHEAGFDRFIDDLRLAAPLASTPVAPTAPTESLAASNVVHGLDILDRYERGEAEFQAIYSQLAHDDVHLFESVQQGLRAPDNEWVSLHRDFDRAELEQETITTNGTNELLMRNQFRAWSKFMTLGMEEPA